MIGSVIGLLMLSANATDSAPRALLLDIGLVRVAPTRPGTDKPWDPPEEKPRKNLCESVGVLTSVFATPAAGAAIGAGCNLLEGSGDKTDKRTKKHNPTEPDLFVRILAGPGVSYRSYTVQNTLSHIFHFRVVVPTDAIPPAGLELQVQDDDGGGEVESEENIGSLHLSRRQLLDSLTAEGPLKLDDKQGGLEQIEIAVSPADERPRRLSSAFDVAKGWGTFERFEVNAGEVLEVTASGQYRVAGQLSGPVGLTGDSSGRIATPPFDSANRGAAILMVGKHGWLTQAVLGECRKFVSLVAGIVLLSTNAVNHALDSGDISFAVMVRPSTRTEWLHGEVEGSCESPKKTYANTSASTWSDSASNSLKQFLAMNGAVIAEAIQRTTHPTGSSPQLASIDIQKEGDGLAARIEVKWHGGLSRAQYSTTVLWTLNARRHIRADVVQDSAAFAVARPNAQQLDQYFSSQVYQRLITAVPSRP